MRLTKLEPLPGDRFALTLEDGSVLRCGVQEVLDFGLRSGLALEGETLEIRRAEGIETRSFPQPEALGKGYWGNGHIPCIRDFYRCLASGDRYPNDLEGVRDTVMLMLELYDQGRKSLGCSADK